MTAALWVAAIALVALAAVAGWATWIYASGPSRLPELTEADVADLVRPYVDALTVYAADSSNGADGS